MLKYFVIILFFFTQIECLGQTYSESFMVSSGINISTQTDGHNRLNYTPYPFIGFSKDIINNKIGIFSIELNYLRKGGNEGFLVIDTTVWESFYGDNLNFLKLDYVGLGLAYRHSIFNSNIYYSIAFKLNYLFHGKKYDYLFDYKKYKLTTLTYSIFDRNNLPFYIDKVVRFEKCISFGLVYKCPFIRKTYFTSEYNLGLNSVFLLDRRINQNLLMGLKVILK